MSDASTDIADHRAIIAALSHEDRQVITAKSDLPGLVRFGIHFGLVLALGSWIAAGGAYWQLLLVPQGILIAFLFTPLHEAIHDTAFRTPLLNRAVSWIAGTLLFLPPLWFRYFHFAHHRHTHDPDNDPELLTPKPKTVRDYAIYLSGFPYYRGMAQTLAANAMGTAQDRYVPPKGKRKMVAETRLLLGVYATLLVASLAAGSAVLVWVWLVPLLLGQPFLRAYLLAEHTLCPHVADMFTNTRTTFTNRLVRFLAWNMPYHAEHHAYPGVPFHQLPRFHAMVREHLRTTENGYRRFHAKLARSLD
ncbi:MAG: fatty acid desaturase [Rhizobiaceae bacterium]|nr:fatty acid desaturase [Rhizobiaceae bacterium]